MLIGALGYDKDDVLQVILIGQTLDANLFTARCQAEAMRFMWFG